MKAVVYRWAWIGLFFLIQCGSASPASNLGSTAFDNGGPIVDSESSVEPDALPFEGLENGDDFSWGYFIRNAYKTQTVTSLPQPIYLAYFNEDEEEIILEGIEIANQAVGFEVFEVVSTWTNKTRVIYKVTQVDFEGQDKTTGEVQNFDRVVGYTYSRNVYRDGLFESGRIVTDWAMELKEGRVSKWVVAHELGHALGIQKHAFINYERDSLEELENNSLMGAVIGLSPVLSDYESMMFQQGELLVDYFDL